MMWKMSNKKRKMAFLTALIGSLMAGSSVGAANLMATIPSDYTHSQMGGVTGSRVTTKVDQEPLAGAVQDLNGDPAIFSLYVNGESQIYLRQYTYDTTALKESVLIDADGNWSSSSNPKGSTSAVPNAHAVAGYGNFIYATGYDNGKIGLIKVSGSSLLEDLSKTIDLKKDIKEKTGDEDAKLYDTYKNESGQVTTTKVHGEGLLAKDGYLYVAVSVNLQGDDKNYDNGYLMQYRINNDGSLTYTDYARIGKNTNVVRLNSYNQLIFSTAVGGYQNYGKNNPDSSLDYVNINKNHIGQIHEKRSITLPEHVKNDGYDFRDMKVLPNGTVYILKYVLSETGGSNTGGFTGKVYQTTMANLMSKHPDDWKIVQDGTVAAGGGWFGQIDAEYYTKRLWVEWGNNLFVYEDGDTTPTHQWESKDFSTDKGFAQFNAVTMLPTDKVWGNLAELTTYKPEGLTASSQMKKTVENAEASIGTATRTKGITGTKEDLNNYGGVTTDHSKYTFKTDEVFSLSIGTEGDHATNAAAVIQAKDGEHVTVDAAGHTLQLASKNYIASPVGIYAGNGKNVTVTADKVNIITEGYQDGNSLTNAIWNDGGKNTASQITVNGDVNISMSGGYGGHGIAIQKSDRWGENSQDSSASSSVTINGNLKIAGKDSKTWGIPINWDNVLSRFNNAGILTNIEKSKVTVTGDVDMAVYGNGITTNARDSEVSIGGGHIAVPQGTKYGYYTLGAYAGTINVNMNEAGSAAGTHDVQLDGDVFALKSTGTINLGLTTKNSYLHGIVDNGGKVNMWLQNGAVWTNEAKNTRYKQDDEDVGNHEVSRVTYLHGGTKSNTAGVIIQTENSKSLTIDKFSGAAKVLYSHDRNIPTKILGGDVTIGSAIRGSEIVLRTDYDDNMQSDAVKNQVLNALAKKLYYKDAVNDWNFLAGKVEIAEGLTASSVAKYTGKIAFNQTNGQGSFAGSGETPELPTEQTKTLFTSSMTGGDDKEYKDDHVWQDQVYTFTKDKTTVQVEGGAAVNAAQDVTIRADEKELDLIGSEAGIRAEAGKTVDVTAGTLKVNGKTGIDAVGTVTLKGTSEITGTDKAVNVQNGGSVTLGESTISGDVANGGDLTLGAATTVSGSITNAGILAVNGETHAKDLTTTGTMTVGTDGVLAADNINVNGGTFTANGSVSSTVKADKGGKAILKGKKTALKGLVSGDHSSIEATLSGKDSALNGSLDGAGSVTLSLADQANWTGNAVGNGDYAVTIGKDSTWTGSSAGNNTSLTLGGTWNNRGTSSLKQMAGNGGVIDMTDAKAGTVTIQNYGGSSTYIYKHDTTKPADANSGYAILGGDVKISQADKGSEITLLTDRAGLDFTSTKADEKNLISGTLNALAGKLYYTGYADGNLSGTVKIAEGLTASSTSLRSETITFSTADTGTKKAGQGFYDYTPATEKVYNTGAITKSEDISLSRELDESGVAHVSVTESNAGNNKFASAIYAGESTSPSSPMTVKMSGKGLALNAAQSSGQAAAIYAGANTYIKVINPSADQKLTITANNTDTRGAHGIYADAYAHLNISGPVEITDITTKGDSATGINIQGKQSEIIIDGSLTIGNVKGIRERGAGMNASGIQVTGDSSTVTVSGPVDISGVRGSGIKLAGKDTKVSVGGGTITAAEDSDHSNNFYAVRVDKGTLDINMKDGAAGSTTTKITGDMYATGQYGKKVVEYTGGELIDWKDAGILNVALTDKDSFWKGVAAYDMYNDNYGAGGNTMHDIGQFNLYLQNGAAWTNEQQSHVTTTTASKAKWDGSTLATLHGGSNAANAGLIYQKDTNPISVVNYSGHTTVFYDHDAADPTKMIGGSFHITNAAEGSAITFITDNKGITSGFADGDSADAKDKVANVLNNLAGKLFYKNYTDGHLSGVVKIAEGLTASSKALKTGDISFSTDQTGTGVAGQGYYAYTTSKPGSQTAKEFTAGITGDASVDTAYADKGVLKDDGTYVFTADSTTITPEKHLIAGGAWLPQIGAAISGSDEKHNVTMDMNGNKLTVDTTTDTHTTGIAAIGKGVVNIKNAGAMSVSATSTKGGQTGALFVNAGGTIQIHNAGADHVLTLRAKSTAPANAAVIKSMNGVSGVMSSITVDGLVDILADKSGASGANEAISAVASKVEIGGGVIKAVNGAEYAIRAYGEFASKNRGQVNVNVKKDAKGAIIGVGSNTVQLEGNIYLGGGMDNAGASADVSLGLNTKDSFWKGDVSNANGSSAGIVNLYMGSGASWTGNNLSGNTVNADLDNATWTGYSNGNAMHLKLDNSIWNVNGASKLASFSGDKGSIFVASDAGNISVGDYSGNTTVIYNHDVAHPTNILGGSFTIGQANTGSKITLITDNQGITKGFNAYDKAEDQNTVNEVLNKLAQKLFYTANDGKLAGTVKIAEGLTAASKELKTGNISFSTDATGTKTPGQGFYEYTVKDDSVITDPITGNLDKKYVNLGIETEKGIYNFTQDTVIDVTKGDYSSNLGAIESSGGPITINADGKNLDVSYHVRQGSNVSNAVATSSYGKSKDVTITAKSLKLSTDTTGFRARGVYATGGKITIDADTTISTSAQTESNGIYSSTGGTVTMSGNLTIQKDSKAANYIALKSDDNGVINVNMKDGKAVAGIVKIDGDVFTKSEEIYDEDDDETTSTSSTVNLALQGKDSSWNGRSLYKVTSGDDSTSYGTFNLWLTDGATWTNEKNGKEVPRGFTGSHVTKLTGGNDEAHAGNIFQNDAKNITIDNYSGNTNIYYAHTGNGEAASDYTAGDTIIKSAAAGSQISLITDNTKVAMDNEYSVANVLNALAGKLTYSAYAKGEKHLTGYVKIADGLTASSAAMPMQTGNITFSDKDGKGSLAEGTVTPGVTYPEEQVKDSYTQAITGSTKDDYIYKQNGVLKEEGKYTFTKDPTKITVEEGSAIDAEADITIDTSKAKLELSGKDAGIKANGHQVSITGNTVITGEDAISASNGGKVTLNGMTDIKAAGEDGTAISVAGKDSEVAITGHAAASIMGAVYIAGGNLTVNTSGATTTMKGDVLVDGGKADITLGDKASTLTGNLSVSNNGQLTLNVSNGAKATGSYAAGDGTLTMNVKDGGYWILKDAASTTSLYATSLADAAEDANAPAAGTLNVNGGRDKAHTGYIDMTERTQNLDIANFSGYETFIMAHKDDGTFTSGNVNIAKAAAGSGLTLYTANNGIDMTDKAAVTNILKALAQKAIYEEGNDVGNDKNLTGEVKIGEGLTSSSAKAGKIDFSNLIGQLVDVSIQWEPTIEEGDYETFVMKGARSAVTTSFHSWRDNMQDTYTGADLADEDGIFAKALGGKTSSDVSGLKDSNSYWGAQIGYDKALANGWHTGVAFDYRDGDSDYLLGGKGDNKLYSFGVYGVKKMENGSYFRVAAKAGRVENEYDVYTELRNKLHADYKSNAYGLTAEYGKTFGSEMSYITPKVQLTWSRVGSKDYSGSANNGAIMNIYQDSYDSLVGRLGFEAGMKKAHGSLHAGLYLAHEFNGDIDTRYFAKDGGWKSTSFDGDDTWAELVLGGEYRLGGNTQLYADFARDLGGDFQRKWKLNAGIRLRF